MGESGSTDDPDLNAHLRAGVAIYNAGRYHAAHDAWEDHWLDLERDTDDELFLHGLIQFTAAVHHAHGRNWDGATGLSESAREYLADLPADYRGVNVGDVREWLARLGADPELVERVPPLELRYEDRDLLPEELEFPAAAVAAVVLAEENDEFDETVLERAAEYGFADLDAGVAESPFVTFVLDFVAGGNRRIVMQRLREHVERRAHRERDVEGLFDEEE